MKAIQLLMKSKISSYYRAHYSSVSNDLSVKTAVQSLQGLGQGIIKLDLNETTGVAMLCLQNSEKKNALSGTMMTQLSHCVTELENWTRGRGVIMYGEGNTFCSGADKMTVQKLISLDRGNLLMSTLMHDIMLRYMKLPMITVAVVQGSAIGGGAELSTWSDFRLIAPDAYIQFVQARMGLTPGWGGGSRLVQLVGPTRALELLSSSCRIADVDALNIGLVQAILKTNSINDAENWIKDRTFADKSIIAGIKQIICHSMASKTLVECLQNEKEVFQKLLESSNVTKALNANIKFK